MYNFDIRLKYIFNLFIDNSLFLRAKLCTEETKQRLQGSSKCKHCIQVIEHWYLEPPSSASHAAAIGGGVGGAIVAIAVVIGVIVLITTR